MKASRRQTLKQDKPAVIAGLPANVQTTKIVAREEEAA